MKQWFKKPIDRKEALVCGLAATLFPSAISAFFSAHNIKEFHVSWTPYLILGVVALLSVIGYFVSIALFRAPISALAFCVVCWMGCYLQHSFSSFLLNKLRVARGNTLTVLLGIVIIACAVALLLRKTGIAVEKVAVFSAVLILLLIFNLASLIRSSLRVGAVQSESVEIKNSFLVAQELETPNIFWIHADGMLNMDSVWKYFEDSQQMLTDDLLQRGFKINPMAHFECGHATGHAIPVLTSPYAYDTWIEERFVTHEAAMAASNDTAFLSMLGLVRQNGEMQNAFAQKGYTSIVIGLYGEYYPAEGGVFYESYGYSGPPGSFAFTSDGIRFREIKADFGYSGSKFLALLLNWIYDIFFLQYIDSGQLEPYRANISEESLQAVLINDSDRSSESAYRMVESLYDVLYGRDYGMQMVIVHDLTPHNLYMHNIDGSLHAATLDPLDYYPQHIWSGKVLLGMIDMILKVDPDAVIVIQSDHGLHGNTEAEFKAAFGEDADAVELWNSTMSAIRVPEKYQTGEEHYAMENPLNISRYLVNSFVGRNYDYLPPN